MRIPKNIQDCTVYLSRLPIEGRKSFLGTAFLIGVSYSNNPSEKSDSLTGAIKSFYLVTAKHVAKMIEGRSFSVWANTKNGVEQIEHGANDKWYYHLFDKTVDLAVIPFQPNGEVDFDVKYLPFNDLRIGSDEIRRHGLGVGDDVFMAGLFSGSPGKKRNWPIIRSGIIAMMPDEPVTILNHDDTEMEADVYLIEARSLGGISGSPVFVKIRNPSGIHLIGDQGHYGLLGVMQGHWVLPSDNEQQYKGINSGIAIVVPATKITEVLNHPDLVLMRESSMENEGAESLP